MTKSKYLIIGLIFIVFVLVSIVVYRIFFMFSKAKIEAYALAQAAATGHPDIAYQLIIEGAEYILKSADLTKQVKLLALFDNIENEKALVLTALQNCYASGFIAKPAAPAPAETQTA